MTAKIAKALDKFYTKPEEVRKAVIRTAYACSKLGLDPDQLRIVEPSAGNGSFLKTSPHLPKPLAFDIKPEASGITQADFLTLDINAAAGPHTNETVFLGNPPFGKRGRLAAQFVNKSLEQGSVCAFILPLIFRKWITQKTVMDSAQLIADHDVPADAFELMGETYTVRCCFQIWTTLPLATTSLDDIRLRTAPARTHPDFDMWQYNATPEAEKYFDYDWDFAVLRQGYGNYNTLITPDQSLSRKKQWIFFKAKSPEVLARLRQIDFEALAETNTTVKGFGKTEIVQHYKERFEGLTRSPQTLRLDPFAEAREA